MGMLLAGGHLTTNVRRMGTVSLSAANCGGNADPMTSQTVAGMSQTPLKI